MTTNSPTSSGTAAAHGGELRKSLGTGDLVLAQVLYIMGLGWVGVAARLGTSHTVFWLLAVALFYLPSAAVVIHLSRLFPLEGGLYQWAKLGFNELTGFLVAWNLWVYVIILNSEIGIQSTTILAYSLGPKGQWMMESPWVMTAASVVLICGLMVVAVCGMQLGRWIQNAGGITTMILFFALIALPFRNVVLGRLDSYNPFAWSLPSFSFLSLNILGKMGFGALGGFEFMAIFAGECKDGGKAVGRSVMVAAPLIALLFMLGTSAVLVTVGPTDIDLVSPISQSLMAGTRPGDLGRSLIPLLLLAVLGIRVAQCSISFAGSARLPLVTGWDHLLPAWFTRLHPRWRTPVNSALFVGLMTMGSGLAAIAGAGRQEAFQLAVNASGVMYASVYMVMFALPVIGFRGAGARAPLWLRAASVSGFLMAALFVVFSVMPIIDVPSPLRFAGKIAGTFLLSNALGLWVYFGYRRRANRAMADAPVAAAG